MEDRPVVVETFPERCHESNLPSRDTSRKCCPFDLRKEFAFREMCRFS
jgi:hypothetical protein